MLHQTTVGASLVVSKSHMLSSQKLYKHAIQSLPGTRPNQDNDGMTQQVQQHLFAYLEQLLSNVHRLT